MLCSFNEYSRITAELMVYMPDTGHQRATQDHNVQDPTIAHLLQAMGLDPET